MAAKQSAGILLYRRIGTAPEVFLIHPGGPFWKNKDAGAWSIPKGEFDDNEDALTAARREFTEETGAVLHGPFTQLKPLKQKAGKIVYAWAVEGDIDPAGIRSNTFSLQWPPKSGLWKEFPEIDKGEWFTIKAAREKINASQAGFLDELAAAVSMK